MDPRTYAYVHTKGMTLPLSLGKEGIGCCHSEQLWLGFGFLNQPPKAGNGLTRKDAAAEEKGHAYNSVQNKA